MGEPQKGWSSHNPCYLDDGEHGTTLHLVISMAESSPVMYCMVLRRPDGRPLYVGYESEAEVKLPNGDRVKVAVSYMPHEHSS